MTKTEHVKIIEFVDVLKDLPDIKQINIETGAFEKDKCIFLCALGFEDRCLNIPKKLAELKSKIFKRALYYEYSNNWNENEINRNTLENCLDTISEFSEKINCCDDDFAYRLRAYLKKSVDEYKERNKGDVKPKFIYDISVCSSQLILSSIRVLMEFDIDIEILYTEAEIYYPTIEEFERESKYWTTHIAIGHSIGVSEIISVYSGIKEENLDLIVAFPTFKSERTQAILMTVDETILLKENPKNIIWVIGEPNMNLEERKKRKEIMCEINEIKKGSKMYEISTLNYKKTVELLEKIYQKKDYDSHLNISALGSKMQSLGIAIFSYIRPEVTIQVSLKGPNFFRNGENCI